MPYKTIDYLIQAPRPAGIRRDIFSNRGSLRAKQRFDVSTFSTVSWAEVR
jgi:hypothetical protein